MDAVTEPQQAGGQQGGLIILPTSVRLDPALAGHYTRAGASLAPPPLVPRPGLRQGAARPGAAIDARRFAASSFTGGRHLPVAGMCAGP